MTRLPAPLHFDGMTFRTQRGLGQHIVPIVGRSLVQCVQMLKKHGNDAAAVIEHYRQADDLGQYGVLAQELRLACRDGGYTRLEDLTVLTAANDPYRYDNPGGRRDGEWFRDLFDRLVPGALHLRGFHYVLVSSTARVLKPDGTPYQNTDADWVWLMEEASTAARFLGLVAFERVLDERNDPPVLPDDDEYLGAPGIEQTLAAGIDGSVPGIDDAMPGITFNHRAHRQPYRIILFGEKSSLGTVLGPLRQRVNGELLLPTGESTITMVFNLAQRIVADGRPAVIFYFSDFDPAGWQMGVSAARKLQALRTLRFPTLDVRLYPVALNYDQVTRLGLPSTPLKETEKRGDRWREAWGREQTEIDALAALNPAELNRIAEAAVAPFWDPTLDARTARTVRRHQDMAQRALAAHPPYAAARAAISEALADLDAANESLRAAQEQALDDLEDIALPPPAKLPAPVLKGTPPEPLFTTGDNYIEATLKLKQHRALYPDDD
jgi:hypothetical protein